MLEMSIRLCGVGQPNILRITFSCQLHVDGHNILAHYCSRFIPISSKGQQSLSAQVVISDNNSDKLFRRNFGDENFTSIYLQHFYLTIFSYLSFHSINQFYLSFYMFFSSQLLHLSLISLCAACLSLFSLPLFLQLSFCLLFFYICYFSEVGNYKCRIKTK